MSPFLKQLPFYEDIVLQRGQINDEDHRQEKKKQLNSILDTGSGKTIDEDHKPQGDVNEFRGTR